MILQYLLFVVATDHASVAVIPSPTELSTMSTHIFFNATGASEVVYLGHLMDIYCNPTVRRSA